MGDGKYKGIIGEIRQCYQISIFFFFNILIDTQIDTFEAKWGFEKAKGVLVRNPSLFAVPVSGYGSAEKAGDETVVMSYVINATRPIGKPLLLVLALLLLKPVVAPYLGL